MQRVRIGLTGLAFVFLLVLLAAAILSSVEYARDDDGVGTQVIGPDGKPIQEPREPLAELGVVPGNPTGEATTNAVEIAPAVAPADRH